MAVWIGHLEHVVEGFVVMRIIGLLLALVMAGCASGDSGGSSMTNAQQRLAMYSQSLTSVMNQHTNCEQQLLQNPDHAAVAAVFPLHDSNTLTINQLSNSSYPTAADMRRVIAFKQDFDQCWAGIALTTRSLDPVFADIYETNIRETNLIIADMARGRLSLGDANRRMQSENARNRQMAQVHFQQVRARFAQQHQSEVAMRQAQAAASQAEMAALGAQMQQIGRDVNANAQANLYNSRLYTAPQVPSYAPRQNTIANCFQTGPVIHCR